jgi:hypothetical protein
VGKQGWFGKFVVAGSMAVASAACSSTITTIEHDPNACTNDADCIGTASSSCKEKHCRQNQCVEENIPEGLPSTRAAGELVCRRVICDGLGGERSVVDTTAIPTSGAPVCKKYSCSETGDPLLLPDPGASPADTPNDCKRATCDDSGSLVQTPDVNDLPTDTKGDCKKPACTADGKISTANDDADPPSSTCMTYTCNAGASKGTPANLGKSCSTNGYGFVCGASGACNACPTPDGSCTDPGPGAASRTPATAFNFGDIGRCDAGGRTFCGALANGQSAHFKYRDDGTGPLCEFDPVVSITPTGTATLCEYFTCPSVTCPSGSTPATQGSNPGCCITANSTTAAMRINYCYRANVQIAVTATSACTGYMLSFNQ